MQNGQQAGDLEVQLPLLPEINPTIQGGGAALRYPEYQATHPLNVAAAQAAAQQGGAPYDPLYANDPWANAQAFNVGAYGYGPVKGKRKRKSPRLGSG